jgi:hypothetical protein
MPNWCDNRLRVFGPPDDIEKFRQQAAGHAPWCSEADRRCLPPPPFSFHSLLPVPLHVLSGQDANAMAAWQLANWGAQWEPDETELLDEWDTGLSYAFNTPWLPPVKLLKSIGPEWPTLKFLLHYEEPGEQFYGLCKVADDVCEDHCLNL